MHIYEPTFRTTGTRQLFCFPLFKVREPTPVVANIPAPVFVCLSENDKLQQPCLRRLVDRWLPRDLIRLGRKKL